MFDAFNTSCKQASRLLSESREHPLPFLKMAQLKAHLKVCDACAEFQKQLAGLHEIFGLYSKVINKFPLSDGPILSNEAKARMKATLMN